MRVGVDVGGTFTDFVLVFDDGTVRYHKVPSTPSDPSAAILSGLEEIAQLWNARPHDLVHGSTVATNAVLERKGARTALVASRGFEDAYFIGRQVRPALYDLDVEPAHPLVAREHVIDGGERMTADGETLGALGDAAVARIVAALDAMDVESVAVCFLFSYAFPNHERMLEKALARPGRHVSVSSGVVAEYREYERMSTTVVNAYVAPVMDRYLKRLQEQLPVEHFRIMQSNGGSMSAGEARRLPVHTILSGPAGGVAGASIVGRRAGFERFITFDMGGTSTDVALHDRRVAVTAESAVEGLPLRVPMIDIHTVGAGGGSLARIGPAGALLVGPESAGARPGPVCYGRGGTRAAVTDANLFLGRLSASHFLGGHMRLDEAGARAAIETLAREAGTSPDELAAGIVRVVNSNMERAIRVISVERGHDMRDFALLCFGGAGGLHAAELARELGMTTVIVPPSPGTLSAYGVLNADVIKDLSRTVLGAEIEPVLTVLEAQGRDTLRDEGIDMAAVRVERAVDVRYAGQSYEITVPYGEDFAALFHAAHRRLFGHADEAAKVEVVNARVSLVVPSTEIPLPRAEPADAAVETAAVGEQRAWFGTWSQVPLYDRDRLRAGHTFNGPAIVVEYTSTTVVPPGWTARVDAEHTLLLSRS